jgi:hypothetical protein
MITRIALRTFAWGRGRHDPRPCPVCERRWVPWAGSYLPCHLRCLFAPGDLEALVERFHSGALATEAVAERAGITVALLYQLRRTREWKAIESRLARRAA